MVLLFVLNHAKKIKEETIENIKIKISLDNCNNALYIQELSKGLK